LLNAIESPAELAMFPGLGAHPLKGDLAGFWSVTITGNRRIIFRFGEGAFDVDLLDYH
jgi:proteic killer suppression protein